MASTVGIIGAGRVGTAVAIALKDAGFHIVGVASRGAEAESLARKVECERFGQDACKVISGADIVFITTPDREIEKVSREIAPCIERGVLVAHTSGAYSSRILVPIGERGGLCLSMHPCQSFSDLSTAAKRLRGCYFCLEGDNEAVRRGSLLAEAMKCGSFAVRSEDKTLYHVACSISSNYFIVLVEKALSIFEKIGIGRERSLEILMPLLKGTLDNIIDVGVRNALTGPIERGEVETIRDELEVIEASIPELKDAYVLLGKEALRIAVEKGELPSEVEQTLSELFG